MAADTKYFFLSFEIKVSNGVDDVSVHVFANENKITCKIRLQTGNIVFHFVFLVLRCLP